MFVITLLSILSGYVRPAVPSNCLLKAPSACLVADERSSAKLFASLAMRVIAPRTLRFAGYEALAAACENERDMRPGGAAAVAQHTIGRDLTADPLDRLRGSAYGACADTSTCVFYAGCDEIETVIQTGLYCARALMRTFGDEDEEDASAEESEWIWNRAVASINLAADRC